MTAVGVFYEFISFEVHAKSTFYQIIKFVRGYSQERNSVTFEKD